MKTQVNETSPQLYARVIGLLYLIVILAGMFAQMFISGKLIVDGDAAATTANILSHRSMFQLGFTVYLIEMASQIAMTVLLYLLYRPVSRSVALLALFFGIIGCVIKTLSRLFYIAPLLVLGEQHYLSVFSTEQLQALALLLLKVNDQAAGMALAFFGFSTFLNGFLILSSNFLPPFILLIGIIGSISQILWFLIKGVNVEQWNRLALETT